MADAERGNENDPEVEADFQQQSEQTQLDSKRFRTSTFEVEERKESGLNTEWASHGNNFIRAIIVLNSIVMGVQADSRDASHWVIVDNIFVVIFAVEMFVKLYLLRWKYLQDHWNRMDFILAWFGMIDVWILSATENALRSFSAIRIVRLVRLIRILRMGRTLHISKQLTVLAEGLYEAIKSLVWIGVLLVLIIYTFALFCTSAVNDDMYEDGDFAGLSASYYFGSMGNAMVTLLNMCILDEWGGVTRPVFQRQPELILPFLVFLLICTFGVLNLVIGVIAERTLEAGAEEERRRQEDLKRDKMRKLVIVADEVFAEDTDGSMTREEFELAIKKHPGLLEHISQLDLPRGFHVSDLHLMLDEEYEGSVSKKEFLNGMFRLVFSDDFQRNCCIMLTVAQVKKEVKDGLKQAVEEIMSAFRKGVQASNGISGPNSPARRVLTQELTQPSGLRPPMLASPSSDLHRGHVNPNTDSELARVYTELCKQLQCTREMLSRNLASPSKDPTKVQHAHQDGIPRGGVQSKSNTNSSSVATTPQVQPAHVRSVSPDLDAAPEPRFAPVSRAGSFSHPSPHSSNSPGLNFPI
jgi:voltage-gated sodium channel